MKGTPQIEPELELRHVSFRSAEFDLVYAFSTVTGAENARPPIEKGVPGGASAWRAERLLGQ
jgi:hypothetical protein